MQFVVDLILLSIYAFLTISIFVWIRRFWLLYVNQKFSSKVQEETIMLEIKLPREIDKSPLAMEMVLSNLTQAGGVGDWRSRGIGGSLPATFSLEIASLEGVIHFYIRTHKKFKELLSASLYAHYPGVEVVETNDYTALFPRYEHNKKTASIWGNGYKLSKDFALTEDPKTEEKLSFFAKYLFFDKPDKAKRKDENSKVALDVFPMRTYIDLGLDKQKEEMKVDPLVSILEFLGSLGKGQYAALQFIIQDEDVYNGKKFPKVYFDEKSHDHFSAKDIAEKYKDKLRGKKEYKKGETIVDKFGNPMKDKPKEEGGEPSDKTYGSDIIEYTIAENSLKLEEKNAIELVERKMAKPLLACVCRAIFVTKPEAWNGNYVQNMSSLFKPFNAPGFNTMGPSAFSDPYPFSWNNPNGIRSSWRGEEIFDAFVEREGFHPHTGTIDWFTEVDADRYFYKYPGYIRRTVTLTAEAILDPFGHPHADEVFVLNTEELATLFHLPGLVATVPTLPRIDSRKAVAPVNLPI
jgi:hypothetical protein